MSCFAAYLHNPLSVEFHSELMKIASFIVKERNGTIIDGYPSGYNIVTEIEKKLEVFKNRKLLEKKGLSHFLEELKNKVLEDYYLIGELIYCCDELPNEQNKHLTKYRTTLGEEIDVTIKSVSRIFLKEYFEDDIDAACKKMIQWVII